MRKIFTLLLICLVGTVGLFAQTTYFYSFHPNAGNPGGLNTQTDATTTGWVNEIIGPQSANVWSAPITIPFAFDFYGTPVTQLIASQNGVVSFDPAAVIPGGNGPLPSANLPDMSVAVYWDDFTSLPPTGSGDNIQSQTFGTAPNRQLWIRWFSFEIGNPSISFAYFAMVLEETTNKIYMVDLYSTTGITSTNTVGVQMNSTTAVEAGSNLVLAGNGTSVADNDYWEFEPIIQVPLDVTATGGSVDFDCGNSATATVTINLVNQGTLPLTGITASFIVDGGSPTTPEVVPGTLAPGAATTYTFTATADVSASGPHTVEVAAAVLGENDLTDNTFSVNINNNLVYLAAPFLEDFETAVAGSPGTFPTGWTFTNQTTYQWYVETDGVANSSSTGPLDDHTPGGQTYVYTEASNGSTGNIAELLTPCIDLGTLSAPKLKFWYHMYGVNMSKLYVDVITNGTRVTIDSIIGQQQTGENEPWLMEIADLSSFAGQIVQVVFVGVKGASFEGDLSLDDIEVFEPVAYDLQLLAIEQAGSGCGLDSFEVISITVANVGTDTVMSGSAQFAVDGGVYSAPEAIGMLLPGDTISFTFAATADLSVAGLHSIAAVATAATPADLNTANDSASATIDNIPAIAPAFPYQENFDNGPADWTSGGTNSSWVLTTPAKIVINSAASGPNSWVTNATGLYNASENSWVASPCIDMTNAPANSWVSLKIWVESEFSWDGAVLQSSTDGGTSWVNVGGLGDPNNWYNDNTINGAPGGSQIGWTGRDGSGTNGWVLAAHVLNSSLIGQPNVRFRIAFGSDPSVQDDGFAFDDFTISEPPVVTLGDTVVLCNGGTLDAGNPGSTYTWSTGDTTQTISLTNTTGVDIIDSVIFVNVVDIYGLEGVDTVVVTIPAVALSLPTLTAQVVVCEGDSTGYATASVAGGLAPYTYSWSNGVVADTIFNVPAGMYGLTVTDALGCTVSDSVPVSEIAGMNAAFSDSDALCAGDASGMASVSISGGTAPYAYSWSNGATTDSIMGLAAGMYSVQVSDVFGCLLSDSLEIGQPDSLSVSLDNLVNVDCPSDASGEIQITVAGGTAPYFFSWSNGDTTEDVTGLMTGDYTGIITDANGCQLTSPTLTVIALDTLPIAEFSVASVSGANVTFVNSSVGADSVSWDFGDTNTSTDLNPVHTYSVNGIYTVTLTAYNGCGNTVYSDSVMVTTVGIKDDLLGQRIQVYPNPNSGSFDVRFEEVSLSDVSLSIFGMDGKQIYSRTIDQISGVFVQEVSLTNNIAKGVYLLEIRSSDAIVHKRIMIE
ncbi:MAG: PKD domain-containing protein [Bacteroidia bacterium]